MKKAPLLFFFMALSVLSIHAQKKVDPKDMLKTIQTSDEYIYGIGRGSTVKEASQMALEELVSSISTNVESTYDYSMINVQNNDEFQTNVNINNMVKTYSRMTLNNTKQLIVSTEKDKVQTVVRYLTKQDLQDMFDRRSEKIKDYVKIARRSAKNSEIGKALQNYYWAMALLLSYPDGYQLQIEDDDYNQQYAYTWIPGQMKKLLKKINIEQKNYKEDKKGEEKIVTVAVTYDGTPTDEVAFTCTDGSIPETELLYPKKGKIDIFLPFDTNERKLVANINYTGRHEAAMDPELMDVLDAASSLKFKEAEIKFGRTIEAPKKSTQAETRQNVASQPSTPAQSPITMNSISSLRNTDTAVASEPKTNGKAAPQQSVSKDFYSYTGEMDKGKPDGSGTMTFNRDGVFDGVEVKAGDYMKGDFFSGHIYIVSLYDKDGNLKKGNIIKEM